MKTITGIILLLTSLQSFAVCQSTDVVYESEGDDEGVTLEHVYTCDADGEELCIYSNSDMASVTGLTDKYSCRSIWFRSDSLTISFGHFSLNLLVDFVWRA